MKIWFCPQNDAELGAMTSEMDLKSGKIKHFAARVNLPVYVCVCGLQV